MQGTLHVHAPQGTAKESSFVDCPSCKKVFKNKRKSLHLMFFTPWYGWSRTCIICGRQWYDGEWQHLEFYRNARRDNIRSAKKQWREMPPVESNHFCV